MPTDTETTLWLQWGANVRRCRVAAGMTSTDLARQCQTSAQRVFQIENGECGTSDALKIRVADALGVPTGDLFPYPDTAAAS